MGADDPVRPDPAGGAKVILHVGLTKAGSTAIQNTLESKAWALLEHGILFPRSVLVRQDVNMRERTPGHLGLLRDLAAGGRSTAFEDEVARHRPERVILSIENLFHHYGQDRLEALARYLAPAPVTLVAILRRQDAWLQSRYFEITNMGFRCDSRSAERFAREALAAGDLDYAARLDWLAGIFRPERVLVLDYDRASTAPGGIAQAFLHALGCPLALDDATARLRANVSASFPEGTEAMRRLNVLAGPMPRVARLEWSWRMRRHFSRLGRRGLLLPGHPLPSRRTRDAVVAGVALSNRRLAETWLDGARFGPDPRWGDAPAPPADPATVARLFDRGLLLMQRVARRMGGAEAGLLARDPAALGEMLRRFRAARVLLHLGRRATLDLAAALEGPFVIHLAEDRAGAIRRRHEIDRRDLSTRLVVATEPLEAAWRAPWFREPDLVHLSGPQAGARLAGVLARIGRPTTVLVERAAWRPWLDDPRIVPEADHGGLLVCTALPAPVPVPAGGAFAHDDPSPDPSPDPFPDPSPGPTPRPAP